jgi:hypothetical protein
MNELRRHFLDGDYTHLFILESDVLIASDTVERLLAMDCDVANFTYPMNLKRFAPNLSLCVQLTNKEGTARMIDPKESQEMLNTGILTLGKDKVNNKVITHCGYGCTMVRRKVLEQIDFKAEKTPDGIEPYPDSYFHYDVNQLKFSNKLDTTWMPTHVNLNNETTRHKQKIDFERQTTRGQRRKMRR